MSALDCDAVRCFATEMLAVVNDLNAGRAAPQRLGQPGFIKQQQRDRFSAVLLLQRRCLGPDFCQELLRQFRVTLFPGK